jgi:hypothetical protein
VVIVTSVTGSGEQFAENCAELLETLARIWARELKFNPLPPLEETNVEYRKEPNAGTGVEDFASPWQVAERGWGDCDDLCGYVLTILYGRGEVGARCRPRSAGVRHHVQIERADGSIEDPSIEALRRQGGSLPTRAGGLVRRGQRCPIQGG